MTPNNDAWQRHVHSLGTCCVCLDVCNDGLHVGLFYIRPGEELNSSLDIVPTIAYSRNQDGSSVAGVSAVVSLQLCRYRTGACGLCPI